MTEVRHHIRFLLNDKIIELNDVSATDTLLDYLRLKQRLRGTKEGCAEGDCGACTVLVGRIWNGQLIYEAVNACIRFLGSLDGCHIVTVEYLKPSDDKLHPVQQAMVDFHGSQCGFCTPGFVMSLYGLWMEKPNPTIHEIETALQGNLCRCTGYEPIVKAAQNISSYNPENDPLRAERNSVITKLTEMNDGNRVEIQKDSELFIIPASVDDLADVRLQYPDATIVAGATDVGLWVTKHMRDISPVIFIAHLDELRAIKLSSDKMTVGASVSYNQMLPLVREHFPQLTDYWLRIGGEQVRNMGTIGGNIANGSPIGDTPPALIALGASVILRCGSNKRIIPLENFFIAYGKQDRQEGDFVEAIDIPLLKNGNLYQSYKISKRRDEDISAITMAINISLDGDLIDNAIVACGGMAATPKRASHVEQKLIGATWCEETFINAASAIDDDYAPLSDWRASSDYRQLVAKNLLRRFYLEHSEPEMPIKLERKLTSEVLGQ